MQIELSDTKGLQFLKEYNLTEKPLQIDSLVLKLEPGCEVSKSIGRIFRRYNIIEYKSPGDYISVNDYYKVLGYTCIYQSNTETVQAIKPEELTITLIANHYPRVLMEHLKVQYGAEIDLMFPGIYYLKGLMFPVQIIITGKLSPGEYIWLSRLRMNLKVAEDIRPLAEAYKGKEKHPHYEAVMNLIIRANYQQYEEGKYMCEALRELFADELQEREEKGLTQGLAESILQLLTDIGSVPDELANIVLSQSNQEMLRQWLLIAARVSSVAEFKKKINA
ncbi:MAG: 3-isopropylmalate dehydrogenase [Lachnospiraceae bacterium]